MPELSPAVHQCFEEHLVLRNVLGVGLPLVPDGSLHREILQRPDAAVKQIAGHKRMPDEAPFVVAHILFCPLPCPRHHAFVFQPACTEARHHLLQALPAYERLGGGSAYGIENQAYRHLEAVPQHSPEMEAHCGEVRSRALIGAGPGSIAQETASRYPCCILFVPDQTPGSQSAVHLVKAQQRVINNLVLPAVRAAEFELHIGLPRAEPDFTCSDIVIRNGFHCVADGERDVHSGVQGRH